MRLILDTNTVLSALFKPHNSQAAVIAQWRKGGFEWLTCSMQLEELARVLMRPKILQRITGGAVTARQVVEQMHAVCELYPLAPPFPAICRDPKDDYLVALLVQSRASFLVTGDKDLLVLNDQLPILTVRELIDRL